MKPVPTRMGQALYDDYEHRGLRVFRDLSGNTSYMGLVAFAVTGRRLRREDELLLDDLAICAHVTEPRVWPIKLARIVASSGRSISGYVAGTLALDSALLGGGLVAGVAEFLVECRRSVGPQASEAELDAFVESRPRFPGFGVPGRSVDERFLAQRRAIVRHGRAEGTYWALSEFLVAAVRRRKRLEPNLTLGFAAALLDLGFRCVDIGPLSVALTQPTFLANAVEGAEEQAEVLRKLPPEAVRYDGPPARESPRALAARTSKAARAE